MSEAGDYTPGEWKGHDFSAARSSYDRHIDRSYTDARVQQKVTRDLLPHTITSESEHPLIIWSDVTGSMGTWPGIMFSKLPYLEYEARTEYLGEDVEILFGAIGDATCDTYPLQARSFSKGTALAERLKELVIEKGGGPQVQETYELAALYTARNVHIPNALKPIVIFIGDEAPYRQISVEMAERHAHVSLTDPVTTKDIFDELMLKASVYLIRKPYHSKSGSVMHEVDTFIYEEWNDLLGADRIITLPSADRVVDVIFGLLAHETGRIDYFKTEIENRQRKDQFDTVYQALDEAWMTRTGQSVLRVGDEGRDAKPLF